MHAALAIEELSLLIHRHQRPMPDVRVQVETAAAVAPESDEAFRRDVVSRQCERNDEALPF